MSSFAFSFLFCTWMSLSIHSAIIWRASIETVLYAGIMTCVARRCLLMQCLMRLLIGTNTTSYSLRRPCVAISPSQLHHSFNFHPQLSSSTFSDYDLVAFSFPYSSIILVFLLDTFSLFLSAYPSTISTTLVLPLMLVSFFYKHHNLP